ncbi:hypothetical protein LR48_Vigan10g188000 [Vigna angularis]|uniref:Uncharacterized protein n=1 Tax=Phaseolus angularis TaxID=3914 RepID=A0A0L9VLZ9_PHAAN|nr:hypothetical protein LR48_Vigan10g188000 [Vigna angularis]
MTNNPKPPPTVAKSANLRQQSRSPQTCTNSGEVTEEWNSLVQQRRFVMTTTGTRRGLDRKGAGPGARPAAPPLARAALGGGVRSKIASGGGVRSEIASRVGVAGWDAAMTLDIENGAAALKERWRRWSNGVATTKQRSGGAAE